MGASRRRNLSIWIFCAARKSDESTIIPEQGSDQHDVRQEDFGGESEPPSCCGPAEQGERRQRGQGGFGYCSGALPDSAHRVGIRDRGSFCLSEPGLQTHVEGAWRRPRCASEGGGSARRGGGRRGRGGR